MAILLILVGIGLLVVVSWDAFITVFSSSGAGPLTGYWTHVVWRGLLKIHHRREIHYLLALAGPIMLISVIVLWYLLLGMGWACLFLASPGSVVDNQGSTDADAMRTLYFMGTTISGIGYGDFVPSKFPWTLFSNMAAFTSTVLLTISLSYVLPIVAASIERKYLAQRIFSVGEDIEEFVRVAWEGDDRGALDQYILGVAADVDAHAHRHLVYPILHYFHSSDPTQSPGRAMLLFSDAIHTADGGLAADRRPPASILRIAKSCIQNYAELASTEAETPSHIGCSDGEQPSLDVLSEAGVAISDSETFQDRWKEYSNLRGRLVALCWADGWCDS